MRVDARSVGPHLFRAVPRTDPTLLHRIGIRRAQPPATPRSGTARTHH
ncbi:hypothetical protein Rhow_008265 [Rhodococcus wratislaviensis]|uniref:Uncharacterized protein n=1 Tax=Rhodococcus wratislaviensis TaxID=44752 RepID=A0A402CK53_RHOWR|nr:hypothetical protein Rhow_008265 [Rhodococcus wratislaviensis]